MIVLFKKNFGDFLKNKKDTACGKKTNGLATIVCEGWKSGGAFSCPETRLAASHFFHLWPSLLLPERLITDKHNPDHPGTVAYFLTACFKLSAWGLVQVVMIKATQQQESTCPVRTAGWKIILRFKCYSVPAINPDRPCRRIVDYALDVQTRMLRIV